MNYLSLNTIEKLFEDWADNDPNIASFGFGNPFTINGEPKASQKYPGMWVNCYRTTFLNNQQTNTSTEVHEFEILFYDLKHDNENSIRSDCNEYAARFIRWVGHYSNDMGYSGNPTTEPFWDKWLDDVAGVRLTMTIAVNGDSNYCDDPDNAASHYGNNIN